MEKCWNLIGIGGLKSNAFKRKGKVIQCFYSKITIGCLTSALESPSNFLKAILFSVFPWRSLTLYWTLREVSVAGFHASVSIPLRIPTNFLEWKLRVEWRPFPPYTRQVRVVSEAFNETQQLWEIFTNNKIKH